jgi:F-type H+-transporting ATPase subunit O
MSAQRGEVEITITSAERLDNKTLSRLETAVSKSSYVGQGKKLRVTNKVHSTCRQSAFVLAPAERLLIQIDPEIIGGLIVAVSDRTIDLSICARIAKINKALTDRL